MASSLLLRGIPVLRQQLTQRVSTVRFINWSSIKSVFETPPPDTVNNTTPTESTPYFRSPKYNSVTKLSSPPHEDNSPEYRQWKDREAEILQDIEPIVSLAKQILHTDRYADGDWLSTEDEKVVVEKLLAYHPHSQDKLGSGLDSIMVDRHPQFKRSRCLFVVRTDGGWIDFSYQKCLRAYIRDKYPAYAERFIREHFKRGSG
ncbi:hypothetical protein IFM89_029131 [Coptis chinensis]|uniref:DCL protein n=1 Tax=Coptis chinensis TaxID=261450 RepID=A0A835MFJ1_9MAGN|nr:hypothetical protein IFM89_029131 [Coptis chinensis]